ncbi:MAG: hypothetical protein C0603_05585 [Denitrovibrio sp.]|nr:MAG: hypothetical protein C0603_05585 [Denitrovibrio sp.]
MMMISKFQNKNLPENERLSVTPDVAELLFTTDDKKLYVGDGTTAGGILISDNAFITEDMTLNVPADYTDINEALDFLSAFRIKDNAIVTIQVADGTYTYTEEIVINHPDSANLKIIGNETDPTLCQIWNPVSSSILKIEGVLLNYIDGFYFNGQSNSIDYPNGININRIGFMITNGGRATAGAIRTDNCFRGVVVSLGARLLINQFMAYSNSNSGMIVSENSQCRIKTSCNIANNNTGVLINANSIFTADKNTMLFNNNSYGVFCTNDSAAFLNSSIITGNTTLDIYSENSSFVSAISTTCNNLSPAINTQGNHLGYIRN